LLFVEKQRVSDLNKTTRKFRVFKKVLLTAVAMATMTSQYGGYFWFKVILLENKVGNPLFYFINYF
jgi:hypothetical protein